LFSQGEATADYLDSFFAKHDRPFVSWVQDLEKERFHSAAETLLGESENAGDLAAKEVIGATCEYREMTVDSNLQLMLSIGKLTHLAQMQEDATVDKSMLDSMCIAIDSMSTNPHDLIPNSFSRWS
jgi:nuclear pore complex protein Nup133